MPDMRKRIKKISPPHNYAKGFDEKENSLSI